MLKFHKLKCENNGTTTIRTQMNHISIRKIIFHKNPLFFRIYAGFEADNEKDTSTIGNKTTKRYKQNPIFNGYHKESQLEGILKSGYHKSPLEYNIVDCFANEVKKLENKMVFYFLNTKTISL